MKISDWSIVWRGLNGGERRRLLLSQTDDMASRQLLILFRRDKRRCHLCGGRVVRSQASRDHIIPLSKCTLEQALDLKNMRLAHQRCNAERGNEDLRLAG